MIADLLAIRWESLAIVAGVIALAVWACRTTPRKAEDDSPEPLERVAVQVLRPGQPVQIVELDQSCVLGRARECGVVFDDSAVSKMHARLRLSDGVASIEDLDSTNGTTLNGARLSGPAALRRGDRIGLGTNQIVFLGAPPESEP
jgi:pSer/pThr/pTyr-binding forkhead associated (FHA) protein